MSDVKLSDDQWEVLAPLLPPQPRTGRQREHDRQVLNSVLYRLKTGVRYKDLPRSEAYAARSTVYYWLSCWSEEGVWEKMFQALLGMLEKEGKLDLKEGALDGSFVPAKRGAKQLTMDARVKAPP